MVGWGSGEVVGTLAERGDLGGYGYDSHGEGYEGAGGEGVDYSMGLLWSVIRSYSPRKD